MLTVKLKKYPFHLKHFVLFLTFLSVIGCGTQKTSITRIEGKQIGITNASPDMPPVDAFVKPYKEAIDKDLSAVIAQAPATIDKSGEWQTPMGNLMSDAALQESEPVFYKKYNLHLDFCLLNHGGIRAIIPKGDVTTRTAFEVMPFENSMVVAALKSEQVMEIVSYIIKEKKPHPLAGLTFTIGTDGLPLDIKIQGKPIETGKTYNVLTSDYLLNGGDNMLFFKKATSKYDLEYKLRNVLIDYFKTMKILPVIKDERIHVLK